MKDYGLSGLTGLAFSPDANTFLLWKQDGSVAGLAMNEVPVDMQGLALPAGDPKNVAVNPRTNELFMLNSDDTQLTQIPLVNGGLSAPDLGTLKQHNLGAVNLQSARGLTFDPETAGSDPGENEEKRYA